MKSTGVVRKIDMLGRIVVPMEVRQTLGINEGDPLEIYTEDNKIILQKYQPSCTFCDNVDDVIYFNGKRICKECLEKLKNI